MLYFIILGLLYMTLDPFSLILYSRFLLSLVPLGSTSTSASHLYQSLAYSSKTLANRAISSFIAVRNRVFHLPVTSPEPVVSIPAFQTASLASRNAVGD